MKNSGVISIKDLLNKLNGFFLSQYFLYFIAFYALISSFFDVGMVTICVLMLIISIIFILNENVKASLAPMVYLYFAIPIVGGSFSLSVPFFIVVAITVFSVVYHTVKFKVKIKFTPMVKTIWIYGLGFCLGGFFSKNYGVDYPLSTNFYLTLLVIVAITFFCILTASLDIEKDYLMNIFSLLGIIVSLQIYIRVLFFNGFLDDIKNDNVKISWGGYNGIATVMLFAICSTIYLAITNKQFSILYLAIANSYLLAVLFTNSRGGILICFVTILVCDIYYLLNAKNKKYAGKVLLIILTVYLALLGFALIFFNDLIYSMFSGFINDGLSLDNRFFIWFKSKDYFFENPLFGLGMFHNYHDAGGVFNFIWQSHNSILQLLSSLGLIGFTGYIIHAYHKYKVTIRKTTFHICVLISFITTEIYGLIDCTYPAPYALVPILILLISIDAMNEKERLQFKGQL